MSSPICPDCGYPFGPNDKRCPECGCPVEDALESSPVMEDESEDLPEMNDFNEGMYAYCPVGDDSWLLQDPAPLSSYPVPGDFRNTHPFLGWLFDAWHLSNPNPDNSQKNDSFDTLNNLFFLGNRFFKITVWWPTFWIFFKIWWLLLIIIVLCFLIPWMMSDGYGGVNPALGILMLLFYWAWCIFMVILYICAFRSALLRYWTSFHQTWRRLCKRFCIKIHQSVAKNNINA